MTDLDAIKQVSDLLCQVILLHDTCMTISISLYLIYWLTNHQAVVDHILQLWPLSLYRPSQDICIFLQAIVGHVLLLIFLCTYSKTATIGGVGSWWELGFNIFI